MKKIYFAGSIKGGSEKQKDYFELINYLKNYAEVLTEHIWNEDLSNQENPDQYIYLRDIKWIDECDIIIAEVSIPSLGVGYEIGYAESLNKQIICLYDESSEKELSYMLSGNKKNQIIKYQNIEELKERLKSLV